MKRSLVVGMGIGKLYEGVLKNLGHQVVTVDNKKKANHKSIEAAIKKHKSFDTVHICTPNFTHEVIAEQLAAYTKIMFVEKPGFKDAHQWKSFAERHPHLRLMMVKNNQWRSDIIIARELAKRSNIIEVNWINNDRVPRPGSWFTNKELAWGGVSRDLLPHLLSLFLAMDKSFITAAKTVKKTSRQRWKLQDITNSDYGDVDADGVYNVDDLAELKILVSNKTVNIKADWRSLEGDNIAIYFQTKSHGHHVYPLGLCPEDAYERMIAECVQEIDNDEFWANQLQQDLWIHQQIQL
jgi:predicted dehydrogenase